MKTRNLLVASAFILFAHGEAFSQVKPKEKTSFQASAPWSADYDVRADIAMVYGINDDGGKFEERVKSYRDKGYEVQFMTGIAWGQYKDYFLGEWDGKNHLDEGQVMRNGETIWHGENVPYIVPSANFLTYMKTHVKRAIDAGVTAIYLEEPEFWARAGYGEAFKKEWQKYYGFPWMAQHESPEATYLSSKLKYQLYFNALKDVFTYIKTYSESKGKRVKCYVPTHSLINYSSWQIVSPEASLANLEGMDGYIAQVWTGTSREPVFYNGIKKERVFENAFLEYGSMVSMTAPTGRKLFFLTDPIEDRAKSWDDYKVNYQATFTAQLLYPMVNNYEVMPWPNRIYRGKFVVEGQKEKQGISPAYATQMQVMVNSLNQMPLSKNVINGSHGIGVLLANSMMFQRFPTHAGYDDPQLSNFYGMVIPLLKKGIPVETVHIENLANVNTLKDIKVLIMSYANMKPLSADYHKELTKWVKNGGVLLYYGKDTDPFQNVKEWWNTDGSTFNAPSEHLFGLLRLTEKEGETKYQVGKGKVYLVRKDPKELIMQTNGDAEFFANVKSAYETDAKAGKLISKNNFVLARGPFVIAAVLDENENKNPLTLNGTFIDLFNPELPILKTKTIQPNTQAYLFDVAKVTDEKTPQVLAAAGRLEDRATVITKNSYTFLIRSPAKTINAMRILLPKKPNQITLKLGDKDLSILKNEWDENSKTLLLSFDNYSEGVNVNINW
ncbi:hypothetical protein EZ428_12580 [Pedobacter frigiditerrae]|uniref:Beta-galactosidase trimerisation domain-containing protein n=1 Tax=Pedobacter frigiditerrae TaxID=2530452 RepID=A0A4R0MSY2_9SPHI|nr:hypothetical protein [Pedobacter frigiditerrae]TCC90118.1 hypothetical protein EZ428_12580 [Pedobacter frigiditerrae]